MQAYRSGHNEAVLKTVWVKAHGGSNPSACAKQQGTDRAVCPLLFGEEVRTLVPRIIGGSCEPRKQGFRICIFTIFCYLKKYD